MSTQPYTYKPDEDIIDRLLHRSGWSINLAIIVVNIIVFAMVTVTGGSEDTSHMLSCGADYAPYIQNGEYWRLFTSMFLHFGIQHLGNNMLLLLCLGDYLERYIGKIRYLVIYLLGGFCGNLLSYAAELRAMQNGEYPHVSAGASGAIFAVVGALLLLVILHKGHLENLSTKRMLLMAGISLYIGFSGTGVDNYAHIGGFAAGIILMLILYGLHRMVKGTL